MTEAEAYGKAIDLLMAGKIDYKSVAINLAKRAPKVFVALSGHAAEAQPEVTWHDVLVEAYNRIVTAIEPQLISGNIVGAIKALRELTGWGLKESKDFVDRHRSGAKQPDLRHCGPPAWLTAITEELTAKHQPAQGQDIVVNLGEDIAELVKELDEDPEQRYAEGGTFK